VTSRWSFIRQIWYLHLCDKCILLAVNKYWITKTQNL